MPITDSEHVMFGAGARMSELTGPLSGRSSRSSTRLSAACGRASIASKPDWANYEASSGGGSRIRKATPARLSSAILKSAETATQLAKEATSRGLNCTRVHDYGLHVYYNVRALVERRSHSADGFPWTHPANAPLVRGLSTGSPAKDDDLLSRSVILPVPSNLTAQEESDYAAVLRRGIPGRRGGP